MELIDLNKYKFDLDYISYIWNNYDRLYFEDFINKWYFDKCEIGKIGKLKGRIINESCYTCVNCDYETYELMYSRNYNPFKISIQCLLGGELKYDSNNYELMNMRASCISIDDCDISISFYEKNYADLTQLKLKIIDWIDNQKLFNFEEFIKFGESLGGINNN